LSYNIEFCEFIIMFPWFSLFLRYLGPSYHRYPRLSYIKKYWFIDLWAFSIDISLFLVFQNRRFLYLNQWICTAYQSLEPWKVFSYLLKIAVAELVFALINLSLPIFIWIKFSLLLLMTNGEILLLSKWYNCLHKLIF
jgi:hypothetical protein